VGALAEALAALGERRAAPLLAAQLADPDAPPADVERVAAALVPLATKAEVPALASFFALGRGVVDDEPLANALVSVTRALVRLGAGDVVARTMTDPYTQPIVKGRLAPIVAAPGAPPR
jgi:outer membrane protein assembly factor BamB